MKHRTQHTYPLSHFRQHTKDHLDRLRTGGVETITQNGEAAMVVMSPETYDTMRLVIKRGHLWDEAIARFEAGERGEEAGAALEQIAARLGLDL
ncbi:MAG TPA: type II toxin-antitoxin system prevent-host-death family antitoxin [Thermoanaerobaculia bacterium]|nr:type II toxin-antitoxin system prevent-host-death family antitoxin [Thermoanaerobaculia bacterium]